jgi:hypothetical protein
MECVVYKRRIVLGGIASTAILASSVLTAGTALAVTTPQPYPAVSPLIAGGPMSQVPGVVGAMQAAASSLADRSTSVSGAMSKFNGAMSKFNGTAGAIPGMPGIPGVAQGLIKPGGATVPGVTSGTGNAPPAGGGIVSFGNVTGNNLGNATGNSLGNATGNSLGNTTGNNLGNTLGNAAGVPTGNPGSATSVIPALGGLTHAAPGLSQPAQQPGTGF